jgi:hypothetical protein
MNPQGHMDNASIDIASQLPLGHMTTLTIEDEEFLKDQLLATHALRALFTYIRYTCLPYATAQNARNALRKHINDITSN